MVRSAAKVVPEAAQALFPISTIDSLSKLFRILLESGDPSLGFASILLGVLENSLTCTDSALATIDSVLNESQPQDSATSPPVVKSTPCPNKKAKRKTSQSRNVHSFSSGTDTETAKQPATAKADFPPIELDLVLSLYEQFHALVYSSVNVDLHQAAKAKEEEEETTTTTTRELIKNVTEAIWNSLSKSYVSEKPHIQSLYTYLTGNKVDSFGMALTVVAACQALRLNDVHLVMSEDHVWILFGRDGAESCEVTWHGKSAEDKRGQAVTDNNCSWLYLKGFAVKCESRHMEIAAVVSAMNPAVTATVDSTEMVLAQQRLLWILYDGGHLRKYPMGIGNLADLEELCPSAPTPTRKSAPELFEEAINTAKYYYNNMHVYPYTFYGGYLLRKQRFKDALEQWSIGAHVLAQYRFHIKNDEEMYNEYLSITKDHLPSIMKHCSKGISADSITRDPLCYARLLRFFDGVCLWEERSNAPIVHIIWAKHWISAINKFDASIRNRVIIRTAPPTKAESAPEKGILFTAPRAPSAAPPAPDLDTFLLSGPQPHPHELFASGTSASISISSAPPAPARTSSVITTLSASELFCDLHLGASPLGVGAFDPFSISGSGASGASASSSVSASPFAELAKATGEILIDPGTLSLISALPPRDKGPGPGAPTIEAATPSGPGQSFKSEANNNLQDVKPPMPKYSSSTSMSMSKDGAPVVLSGAGDESEPRVLLNLFSQKMRAVGELLKHNSNSCTLTLALTAQTSFNSSSTSAGGGAGAPEAVPESVSSAGRSRRSCARFQAGALPESIASTRKRKSEDDAGAGTRSAPEKKRSQSQSSEVDPKAATAATGAATPSESEGGKAEISKSTSAESEGTPEGTGTRSLPPKKRGRKIQN